MEKNKKRLRMSEILLIIVVVMLIAGAICFFLLKSGSKDLFNDANAFAIPTLTLGLVGSLENYDTSLKGFSALLSVLACASILFALITIIIALAKKKYRAIFSSLGLIVGSLSLVYGGAMILTHISRVTQNKLFYALLLTAGIVVTLLYATSLVGILDGFRGHSLIEKPVLIQKEMEKKEETPVKEEVKTEKVVETVVISAPIVEEKPSAFTDRIIERVPFEYKLKHADKDLKAKYKELSEHALSYGIKNRISVDGDSYRLHKVMYMMITIAGKKLKVYYKLNPNDFKDSPIPVNDSSKIKKYAEVPSELDVRSDLSLKRAKALLDQVMSEANIKKEELK